ncbi:MULTISPECIES: MFS transporter [unclassified Bacillus cereus group]|uniref:MFS transporter n=1 Tax=unclassified Bacillus cereus group TaxID=2750818 RepID=UPI0024C97CEA|nr:MAG: MFS transporter [Bacillus paranthracis]WAI34882.1 MAG: MFS transporter [Bacillus paranthracis]WAI36998.1 MAG: MFS transporter [Bacillus paranthracis]
MDNSIVRTTQSVGIRYFKLNFFILVFGRLISGIGSAILKFGLSLYVLDITGSAVSFSLMLASSLLPGILVYMLMGNYVDSHNKKKIMVWTDILNGIIVLLFCGLFYNQFGNITILIVFTIIVGFVQSLFELTIQSSVANVFPKEQVAKVDSAILGIGSIINVLGPVIGAFAYNSIGIKLIFLTNAITFLIAGFSTMFLKYNHNVEKKDWELNGSYLEKSKVIFRYLEKEKGIKALLIFAVVINVIYSPMINFVVPYISYNVLRVSSFQLSIIQASWAIGEIIGAIIIGSRKSVVPALKKLILLIQIQALLVISWICLNFSVFQSEGNWLVTIAFSLIMIAIGVFNVIQLIPVYTFFQTYVPEELRARFIGIVGTSFMVSVPFGMAVFGFILEKFNWTYVTAMSGFIMLLICWVVSKNVHYKEFIKNIKIK